MARPDRVYAIEPDGTALRWPATKPPTRWTWCSGDQPVHYRPDDGDACPTCGAQAPPPIGSLWLAGGNRLGRVHSYDAGWISMDWWVDHAIQTSAVKLEDFLRRPYVSADVPGARVCLPVVPRTSVGDVLSAGDVRRSLLVLGQMLAKEHLAADVDLDVVLGWVCDTRGLAARALLRPGVSLWDGYHALVGARRKTSLSLNVQLSRVPIWIETMTDNEAATWLLEEDHHAD